MAAPLAPPKPLSMAGRLRARHWYQYKLLVHDSSRGKGSPRVSFYYITPPGDLLYLEAIKHIKASFKSAGVNTDAIQPEDYPYDYRNPPKWTHVHYDLVGSKIVTLDQLHDVAREVGGSITTSTGSSKLYWTWWKASVHSQCNATVNSDYHRNYGENNRVYHFTRAGQFPQERRPYSNSMTKCSCTS
jgi:hypothetical protein